MRSLLKTLMLTALLIAGASISAGAQQAGKDRFEVRLGISGFPIMPALEHDLGSAPIFGVMLRSREVPTLDDLYKDRDGKHYTTGNIGAEFAWNAKRWLAVCAGAYVTPFWADIYDGTTHARKGRKSGASVSGMVTVRFNYFNRPYVRLYSAVGTGFYADKERANFQLQGVPFGVSFGGRVFGYAEFGIGTLFLGGNIGIGYKF